MSHTGTRRDQALLLSANRARTSVAATVGGGVIGHMIEWYDWTIYGLLSSVFAGQFFPSGNATASLLATLATFALGFIMRPIGAIVLSPLADRYGRRRMLSTTIFLMGLGSLIVALAPPFANAGLLGPALLLLARLLQGFSAGGEAQSAAAFLIEHAPASRRGLVGSLHIGSVGVSILVATGVSALVTNLIAQPALGDWGWRVPFLFGALLSSYGLYIRKRLPETPPFVTAANRHRLESRPLRRALTAHKRESIMVFILQMGTVQFYIWTVFLPTYAHLAGGLPLSDGFLGGILSLVVFCIATPLAGALSDRIGRRPLLIGFAAGFLLLAWPMLHLLQNGSFGTFLLVDITGCLLLSLADGVLSATLCELFPTQVRTSGIGLPYALCSAVFSGTAPMLATWLLSRGRPELIAVYIMLISAVELVTFIRMRETCGTPLG